MTTKEWEKLNKGCTQSNSDTRKFTNQNGDSHIKISDNKVKVDNSFYYGFSDAKKAIEKRNNS